MPEPPVPPASGDAPQAAPIRLAQPAPLASRREERFQLQRLDPEDCIPSVSPWIRHSSTALVATVAVAVAFMAIAPYRVVVKGQGSVRPAGELVLVNAPFEGRVQAIHVRTNQRIGAGQAIVSLDRSKDRGDETQYQQSRSALNRQNAAMRSQTEAELAAASLEVDKTRSAFVLAESEYRRYEQLANTGAVSQSMLDEKRARFRQEQASLAQASKRLEEVRSKARSSEAQLQREEATIVAGLGQAQRRLVNATVRSPVAGVVFRLQVRNPLQTISAGQELASIAPTQASLLVKVAVRGEDIDNVEPGQRADLRLQACPYPDFGTLPARVVAIAPDALAAATSTGQPSDPSPGQGLYEVTIRPERGALRTVNRLCELRLGMQLEADITTRKETLLHFLLRKMRLLVGT